MIGYLALLGILFGRGATDYAYEIPYNKPADQYSGLAHPKPGAEIDQMDVAQMEKPNQIRISYTGTRIGKREGRVWERGRCEGYWD